MSMKILLTALACLFPTIGIMAENKIISVDTDKTSMVMQVNPDGKLIHDYYGKKFNGIEPFLIKQYKEQPDNGAGYAPMAYPAYGGLVSIQPALKLTHKDGVQTTDLRYDSHKVTQIDDNREKTEIVLTDPQYDIKVILDYTAYKKQDIITESVTVLNNETGKIAVENIAASYLPLHADDYYLTHFNGIWAAEMQLKEDKLTPGIKSIESKKGLQTTAASNPAFMVSLNQPLNENNGEVYAGALAWSGNFKNTFEIDECDRLHIVSGPNDFASTYYLEPGESLTTPEMIWAYSNTGSGTASRNFHDWVRNYNIAHPEEERAIVLNSWEGAYFDFNEKTITDMIDDAAAIGVEMFVLDDGWFGNGEYARNSDHAGLGDWQVNTEKLPKGIDYLAKYAKNKGLKFGIWIEPEMVNPQSELAKAHPEWIVKSGKRDKIEMRNQLVLDLSNPEVQDFIVNTFDNVLKQSPDISYVKWDANRYISDFGSEYLPEDKQSHFWIDYINGLYSVYDRIREMYPDVTIQLCSSGGARLDMGALKYHDEFWTSDNTNAMDRIFIQYSTNLFYPSLATAAHVSTAPNHQTGLIAPLKFRFDVASSGRLGLELQPKDLKGKEREFAENAIKTYKQIRPIVHHGDLYRLKNPYDGKGWASHQYVSKDKSKAVFFAYSLKYHGRTTYFDTKLQGLDPDKNYRITELNPQGWNKFYGDGQVFPGDYLMNAGISLNIGNPMESTVLLLEEI